MSVKREKVVVAMSGGVDSSVAASLLVERGYDVVGLFMRVGAELPEAQDAETDATVSCERGAGAGTEPSARAQPRPTRTHQGCCGAADAADARFVAGLLGIAFYALNFEAEFDRIIDYFADEYANGRTPNPCIVCNDRLKFGKLLDYADAVGARHIATGHYARIEPRNGRPSLLRGVDTAKDQSYVLFGLGSEVLERTLFPVGSLTKVEVRAIADRYGLPNSDKPDSVEICFVPDRNYARVVRERRPEAFVAGDVVDADGNVLGSHGGIGHYTIGQRRGLGISAPTPRYVIRIDARRNQVTLGTREELHASALLAERASFAAGVPAQPFRADAKIRYLHTAAAATVHPLDDRRLRVVFDTPQPAVTPGQAVVFYDHDVVVGGAWITQADSGA